MCDVLEMNDVQNTIKCRLVLNNFERTPISYTNIFNIIPRIIKFKDNFNKTKIDKL